MALDKAVAAEQGKTVDSYTKNHFYRSHRIVNTMLRCASEYPPQKPTSTDPVVFNDWKSAVRCIADEAMANVLSELCLDAITPNQLGTSCKEANLWRDLKSEKYKSLHHLDIPEAHQEVFNCDDSKKAKKKGRQKRKTSAPTVENNAPLTVVPMEVAATTAERPANSLEYYSV